MKEYLKKSKYFVLVVSILEITTVFLMFLFYYLNVFDFQSYISVEGLFYVLIAFVAFDILTFLYLLFRFLKIRYKNNISTESLFGKNVQSAIEYADLMIAVVNDSKDVIWINERFNQLDKTILDQKITDIYPELKGLDDSENQQNKVITVVIKDRVFSARFIKNANVYLFKDITDYTTLLNISREQALVLGIIMIDNYNDLKEDDERASDIMAKVRIKILDYFKQNGVLLRKYSNDSYYAICNYHSLKKMEDNKFEILDEIKALGDDDALNPTLSIGFAHDVSEVFKLNEMANSAIDIAISRGGDQVVVAQYGHDLKFFGGRSESFEKNNRVKLRVLCESLKALIKDSKNVYIMGHKDMDLDSIGSCLGAKALCEGFGVPSKIIFDPKLADRNTRYAVTTTFTRQEFNEKFIFPKDALAKFTAKTLLICCDFHKPSLAMSEEVLNVADKVVVIDHHRRSEEFIENPIFTEIDPSASSASELVAELIGYSSNNPKIKIPEDYATIMLAGIFLDTNFYKSPVCGIRTFEASMILKENGADNNRADEFLKDDYEEHLLISKIISTIKTPYVGVVYCLGPNDDIIDGDTLSKAANECISMKGINASFIIGKVGDKKVKISARSDGTINVQLLMEKMGGGGHYNMAAMVFDSSRISEIESLLLETLRDHLEEAKTFKKQGD